ncbi:NDMA-dependent alcohol dehydrogenase [Frankia sp. CNm7]|uniref:NDMA-dependent alcohol dehydrogenase n=1 Tax=Frankia nepalensis TaxID=1836974 RepID=A0A937RCI5_9ACTN|nr:NDMA-dependent alcohol dehydrogenase [Frankia nepalensis]MBL7496373.1 NDMA-dependent alcohol dehydrogenase [Frankia nepalensis]MBL7511477.1 NDMA-dependent alcohol dehydrogenase [Frankia nepalensis]MBL7521978.1 NDMA-dependent alcohol dehydrogenase [Frankia nepalensis]MBL7627342.1 NDMA-dependent alcohol dehydrogenase [Frankia nepalensis]
MRTRAAVLFEQPGKWEITEVELEPPRQDELLIRVAAAGLCHSDDHIATGDLSVADGSLPMAGGHEGAGIVEAVGPHTPGWKVGDRVVLSFLPMCGLCRWCAAGLQNLCDNGSRVLSGVRADGSRRMSLDGRPVSQAAGVATFSELTTVSVQSAVRCPEDVPLEAACLTSCGVSTGWGAAVRSAEVKPGDVIIVQGVGGIGINAVQGAAHAGASVVIAVDPVEMKRTAALALGATHAVATMAEATDLARGFTNGQGADSAIVCVGVAKPEHVAEGVEAIRKAGTCVLVGMGRADEDLGLPVSMRHLVLYQKRIQGSLFGASSPSKDIPAMLALYRQGRLKLDELITNRYTLETINDGYADLRAGRNLRGVVTFG